MVTETAIQDPKKHALEALKQRFAFVEADLLQQKNKKSKKEGDGKEPHRTTSLADKTDAVVTPSFGVQHKKGDLFNLKKNSCMPNFGFEDLPCISKKKDYSLRNKYLLVRLSQNSLKFFIFVCPMSNRQLL